RYINEARVQNIDILPPDVNVSLDNFTAGGNAIRFGLAAIKGIGQSVVSYIIDARNASGPFKSLFDFTERVDSKALNKRAMESLIRAGAFDSLGPGRARLIAGIDMAIESGQRTQRSLETGQVDLFAAFAESQDELPTPPLPDVPDWSHSELLRGEKETLGFYISGHPLSKHDVALKEFATTDVDRLSELGHGAQVSLGGIVVELSVRTTKKGDRFALFQLEDKFGSVKIVAWPDIFARTNGKLKDDAAVLVRGRLEIDDGGATSVIADEVCQLDNIREKNARSIVIHLPAHALNEATIERLHRVLDTNRGDGVVTFNVELAGGTVVRIRPNHFVRVRVTNELTNSITEVVSNSRVEWVVDAAVSQGASPA
ncbi:MAG TPA: OB-fold nucleic acid binding domain-containing protein, partial [Blastocatellia bacterium]